MAKDELFFLLLALLLLALFAIATCSVYHAEKSDRRVSEIEREANGLTVLGTAGRR